ncbi:MAG TPA: CRISPR-associated protein Cas4 [Candidatus Paceibacterota bacterium]|nr:CRISPR-associated protein Cas4 [Candidatus Paceibacterota bacterium]
MIPLSALNHYLFCPRRAALIHVEGIFESNEHTLRGDIVHEHTDLRGYEVRQGVTLLRALPVFSVRLGLNGKCDIVEAEPARAISNFKSQISNFRFLKPVEFKLGRRRRWENDDAQLCAQALCLEEMFGIPVPRGAVFHADSKRRREVEFTPGLRRLTEEATRELHALLSAGPERSLPPAVFKSACQECSLYEVCLPQVTSQPATLAQASRALFQT